MLKIIFNIFFRTLIFLDKIFKKVFKKSFLISLKEAIENKSYKKIKICNEKINFFIPNKLIEWRINNFYNSEPETLEWIDQFEKNEKIVFWDIGANIGLYSIYNSIKNKNSMTISFEPSSSNLRTLSRNIYINQLHNRIKIFSLPLSKNKNIFLNMKEENFLEGGALNSFGSELNFEGKNFDSKMIYSIFGTSINFLLENKMLEIPNYIKIDVDGIEHLILEGAEMFLKDKKVKSILVEVNDNYVEQKNRVLEFMKKNDFILFHKKNNLNQTSDNKYSKVFNYIFSKKNLS